MNYIDRREAGGESNEKPFNAGQKGKTMEKYSEVWKLVISYIWRTRRLEVVEEQEDDTDTGDGPAALRHADDEKPTRDRRPAYSLTKRQEELLDEIEEAAADCLNELAEDAADNSDDGGGDIDTQTLEGLTLDFFIALLDHNVGDTEFRNALYSGLAVAGIHAKDG